MLRRRKAEEELAAVQRQIEARAGSDAGDGGEQLRELQVRKLELRRRLAERSAVICGAAGQIVLQFCATQPVDAVPLAACNVIRFNAVTGRVRRASNIRCTCVGPGHGATERGGRSSEERAVTFTTEHSEIFVIFVTGPKCARVALRAVLNEA